MQEYNFDEMDWLEEEYDDGDDFDEEIVIIRKRKRGRPKSENSKNKMITLRMTERDVVSLNDMTARYDISRSDLVRKALIVYDHIMGRHR